MLIWLTFVCCGFDPSVAFRFQVRVCAGLSCITNVALVRISQHTVLFPREFYLWGALGYEKINCSIQTWQWCPQIKVSYPTIDCKSLGAYWTPPTDRRDTAMTSQWHACFSWFPTKNSKPLMTDTTRQWHEMTRIFGNKRVEIKDKCTYYCEYLIICWFRTLKSKRCLMDTRSRGCLLDTRLDILVLSSLLLEPRRKNRTEAGAYCCSPSTNVKYIGDLSTLEILPLSRSRFVACSTNKFLDSTCSFLQLALLHTYHAKSQTWNRGSTSHYTSHILVLWHVEKHLGKSFAFARAML